jgi:OOP family OmpA-OmpF porin
MKALHRVMSILLILLIALMWGCATRAPAAYKCALAGAAAGAAAGAGVQAGRDESGGDIAAGAAVGAASAALLGYVICKLMGEEEEPTAPAEPRPEPAPAPQPVRERIILRGVTFGFDGVEIDHADGVVLDEAVRLLQRLPDLAVRIEGHTDSSGPAEYNRYLSEQRAESVMRYLEQGGISADRLTAVGHGESQPIATNQSPKGRARNRRVELQVLER